MRCVAPFLDTWEDEEDLPREVFREFAQEGFTGVVVPAGLGGLGRSLPDALVLAEELMRVGAASVAVSLLLPALAVCPLLAGAASPEVRDRWLPRLLAGDTVAALAVTEPTGGSDLFSGPFCTACRDGGDWVLDGEKFFITNGPIADLVVVLARTADPPGPLSLTLLAVPADTPGFEVVGRHAKLGLRASPTGWLRFRGCRLPASSVIGAVHRGFADFLPVAAHERLLIAAGAVAYAQDCLARTAQALGAPPGLAGWAELEACRGKRTLPWPSSGWRNSKGGCARSR
jgi:alkylation response protein AidB-like acyl-CoA dehydrogenase